MPYLARELALLTKVRVILVLGAFAYDAVLRVLAHSGVTVPRPRVRFAHALEVATTRATILGCYHPSQQNTFTGRLTEEMLDTILARARTLAERA